VEIQGLGLALMSDRCFNDNKAMYDIVKLLQTNGKNFQFVKKHKTIKNLIQFSPLFESRMHDARDGTLPIFPSGHSSLVASIHNPATA
jgi:hypothetical protein